MTRAPHVVRFLASGALVAGLLTVLQPASPAAAAPLPCSNTPLFMTDTDGNAYQVGGTTGVSTGPTYDATPSPTAVTPNQIGIADSGTLAINTSSENIVEYDPETGQTSRVPKQTNSAVNTVAGGINPVNNLYYYGGYNSTGTTFTAWVYNPATNVTTGPVLQVTLPSGGSGQGNGDLAFDPQGRMYLVQSSATTSRLVRVNGTIPTTTPQQTLNSDVVSSTTVTAATNGMAFGSDGFLYISTTSTIRRVNPSSGATVSVVNLTGAAGTEGITDLATCALPSTLQLQKTLPNGRVGNGDQFALSITGNGVSDGNTGTTQGTETGLQNQSPAEVAGPLVALPGQTYTITETASGTTNLGNYVKTWQCTNAAGTVLASGSGSSGSITMPNISGSSVSCLFTNVASKIDIDKTASPTTFNAPGQTITYSFAVRNSGGLPLSNLQVDDGLARVTTPVCSPIAQGGNLAVGATTNCTATLTTTQADLNVGTPIVNTATATGTAVGANPATATDDATVTPVVNAAIDLDKTASPTTFDAPGQTVTYRFAVANQGNVPLSNLAVDDGLARVSTPVCAPVAQGGTLAVGGTTSCTATLTTTQADLDAGTPIVNTATATGTRPTGGSVSDTDDATTTPVVNTGITLDKTASPTTFDRSGQQVTYSFVVRNTGNATLTNLVVDDGMDGVSTPVCAPVAQGGSLGPGATTTCQATYTTTQADLNAGTPIVNTATVRGTRPGGGFARASDDATITPVQRPSVTIDKTVSPTSASQAGQVVTYSFAVANSGNVRLTNLAVDDGMAGVSTPTCSPVAQGGALAVGATTTCTATYTVTQADLNAGTPIVNTATVTAAPPAGGTVTATDDASLQPVQAPALDLFKTADPATFDRAGQQITYRFTVRNRGNLPLAGVTVDDGLARVSTPVCSPVAQGGTLQPGATTTCTATLTTTQADLDAGTPIDNTATATGTTPGGATLRATDVARTSPVASPALQLDKVAGQPVDVNDSGLVDAGDTIAYTFRLTNGGNVTLSSLSVSDPRAGAVTCPVPSLAPGATTVCQAAPYTITEADESAGFVRNRATAAATTPTGGSVAADPDTTNTPVSADVALLTLDKDAGTPTDVNGSGLTDAGDTIAYTFTVTNDGNVPIRQVTVSDPLVGEVTCPTGRLTPGATRVCRATYTVRAADEAAGEVLNRAVARGVDPDNASVTSNADTTRTPVTRPRPALVVDKQAGTPVDVNGSGLTDAGDTITYTFTVTNTGNVPVRRVTVTDDLVTLTCGPVRLEPGEQLRCTSRPYVVRERDEASGSVVNTAFAAGVDPDGDAVESDDDSTVTPVSTPDVRLTMEKTAGTPVDVNGSGITDAGDTIAYTFGVTNPGNVPLQVLEIDDPLVGAVTCQETLLGPGEATECEADDPYVVTEADERAGSVVNRARARAEDPDGEPVASPVDTTTTSVSTPNPRLVLDKTAGAPVDVNGSGITDAGDTIAYTFTVTNPGNVPLDLVRVDAPMVGAVTCDDATLAPGASTACEADDPYVVTEADERDGAVVNRAVARAEDPDGGAVVSPADTTTTTVVAPNPRLVVEKFAGEPVDVNGSGITDAGDTIAFTFTVTNSGNVPVDTVVVDDPVAGEVTCEETTLGPGEATDCEADEPYVVTEADEVTGAVLNTASAAGEDPDGDPVVSTTDSTRTPTTLPQPLLEIEKEAGDPVDVNGSGTVDAGDTIAFTFTVTNSGNVPVDTVVVDDPLAGEVTCEETTLGPGEATDCEADEPYVITEADEAGQVVTNTARARGADPDDGPVVSDPDSTSTPVTPTAAALELEKFAADPVDVNGSGITDAGDTIAYTFTVTNSGNVPVRAVAVADPLVGPVSCAPVRLAPGGSADCEADEPYVVTTADEDAGEVRNTAVASGLDPDGATVDSNRDSTTTPVVRPVPALELDKVAGTPVDVNGSGITDAGDTIAFTFTVTNRGNVPVRTLAIDDPSAGPVTCEAQALGPGATTTCAADDPYVITEDDEAAGSVVNTATATAIDPDGGTVESPEDSTATPVSRPNPVLALDKQAAPPVDRNGSGLTDAGDTIQWTFTVTNRGNVNLATVAVVDPLAGAVTCGATSLAPGASTTCRAVTAYVVTEADERSGSVANTAVATAVDPDGGDVASAPDSTTTPVQTPRPLLGIEKTAAPPVDTNGNGIVDAGDTIAYSFVVTNDGNVPLTGVAVLDPRAGAVTCAAEDLGVGESTECEADAPYVVTAQDEDARVVRNTARATGLDPDAGTVTSPPDSTVTDVFPPDAVLSVEKTAGTPVDVNQSGIVDAGDTIAYTFVVQNVGNVPIEDVGVEDDLAGPVSCEEDTLLPGESSACEADEPYVITEDDELAGSVLNTATPSGAAVGGSPVETVSDSTTTQVQRSNPLLSIEKTAGTPVDVNQSGIVDAGDTIAYTFVVQNVGNVPIDQIAVEDDLAGPVRCDEDTLLPGASSECEADEPYVITEDDELAGSVLNTATATGADPDEDPVRSEPDRTRTVVTANAPALRVEKTAGTPVDANDSGLVDAGDTIAYTFVVTNDGNVPVDQIAVEDDLAGPVSCEEDTLLPGGSTECEADDPYVVTEDDEDTGSVLNTATAVGVDRDGDDVRSVPDSTTTAVQDPRPLLSLEKTAGAPLDVNQSGIVDAGDTIAYTFVVTNRGNVPLSSVEVVDDLLAGVTCVPDEIAPGGTASCEVAAPYVITEADEQAGTVTNTATAQAVPPAEGVVESAPDSTSTSVSTPSPALVLDKTAGVPVDVNQSGIVDAGDTVAYSFVVTNQSNVPLRLLEVGDPLAGAVTCDEQTLAPQATTRCEADEPYVITEDDEQAGAVVNRATASAVDPDGGSVVSDPDSTTTPVAVPASALVLDKSAGVPVDVNQSGIVDAGDTIAYSFVVTNQGNVPVRQLAIADPLAGSVTCETRRLAPGASTECDADRPYVITEADERAGSVTNTATARGLDPDGAAVESQPDTTATTVATPAPLLSLDKAAAPPVDVNDSGIVDAGDTIAYTFTVTNRGNVPIRLIEVVDPLAGQVVCDVRRLEPSGSTGCRAAEPYVITAADERAGAVVNEARARGVDPDGGSTTSSEDRTTTLVATPDPVLVLDKTAGDPVDVNDSGIVDAGDTIEFTFTVTNRGNVPVRGVTVTDPILGDISCDVTRLAPGESTDCSAAEPYVVTEADEEAGSVDNTAEALGRDPDGGAVADADSTSTPVVASAPALRLVKTAGAPEDVNDSGIVDAGDTIAYTFTVTNTGNVPVRAVRVDDGLLADNGILVSCEDVVLPPGESTVCTAEEPYVISGADEAAGSVLNVATAAATDPDDGAVGSAPDRTRTPVATPDPVLEVEKTAGAPDDANDSGVVDAGDTIAYTFVVTNRGNVPVADVAISDPLLADAGVGVTCEDEVLLPGESTACATDDPYEITAADEASGVVSNTATAVATDPDGGDVESDPDSTNTPVTAGAAVLTLDKRAAAPVDVNDSGLVDEGDTIRFSFTVTNDGNVPVRGIEIGDAVLEDAGVGVSCDETRLAPGETTECQADEPYVVTRADELAGAVVNVAFADGSDPDGDAVRSNRDRTTTPVGAPSASLGLEKFAADPVDMDGDGRTDAGDTIAYTFVVTNRGNVPVTRVRVADSMLEGAGIGVTCDSERLEPGESTDCAADEPYVVTLADERAGVVVNIAAAIGQDPDRERLESPADSTTAPVEPGSAVLRLDKRAGDPVDVDGDGRTDAGDTVRYTFVVTNVGTGPVSDVEVVDPLVGAVTCETTSLAAGEATACTADEDYVITRADQRAGEVVNRALARGTDDDGASVASAPDRTVTEVSGAGSSLSLDKRAVLRDRDGDDRADAGERVRYTFVVTNTGERPLRSVEVVDRMLRDAGIAVRCPATRLAPGETMRCRAGYTVTAADVAAGEVRNVATAVAMPGELATAPDSAVLPVDAPGGPGGPDDGRPGEDGPAGWLPDTGGPGVLGWLLGLGLVVAGLVLLRRSRRREA